MRSDPFEADWRVLLPLPISGTFDSLLLLGGSPTLAQLLVTMGLARKIIADVPRDRSVHAVVLLAGAGKSPSDVVSCMRGDGVLYWEVESRATPILRNRPERIRRFLSDLQFSGVAIYRVRPTFENCHSYIPLDTQDAGEWFFHEGSPRKSPSRRLIALWPMLISAFRRGHIPNCYAAVAVREGVEAITVSRGIIGRLPVPALRSATRVLVMKRRGRRGRDRRLILFAFSAEARHPIGVLKVSRTPEQLKRIEAEQSALVSIRGLVNRDMRETLPEPLGIFAAGTSRVGVESYVAGAQRARGYCERQRQFGLAVDWVTDFNRQGQVSRRPWQDGEVEKWIEGPVASYKMKFGASGSEDRLFEALVARARLVHGQPIPLVWRHGELNESNVSFTETSLRVVDWETAAIGLPLLDLLLFMTSWSYRTEGLKEPAEQRERFRKIIFERDPADEISRAVWQAIDGYMEKLEIDRRFVPLLIALNWILGGSPDFLRCQIVQCLAENCEPLFSELPA